MKIKTAICLIAMLAFIAGCATSHKATVYQPLPKKKISTAALVPQPGNTRKMNSYIRRQLFSYSIGLKSSLPENTRKSNNVDIIVTYVDEWRKGISKNLKSLTISIFDGPSGNLLVTGHWDNPSFLGYPDPEVAVKELFDEMFSKLSTSK